MTVADNTSRNQYTATSGQTVFAYTFEIVDKDDVVVLKNGTTLSEGTDYTVSNVGNDNGGNVTLTVGATTGDILTLYRDMPYSRTQNYTNSGDFLASEVNSDFDNLWLAGEQTNRAFSQSIRKPITDSDSISMELPEAADRANKFVLFDSTGAVGVESLSSGTGPTVIGRQQFTGDGTTTVFTLAATSSSAAAVIYIDGVYQEQETYTVVGTTLTFTEAPPTNASIEVLAYKITDVGSTDANAVTYTPAGTGAVQTTVQTKLRESVSVKDFGAVGDGVTDDTAAIQAALNSGAVHIVFPQGTYLISTCTISSPCVIDIYGDLNKVVENPLNISKRAIFNIDGVTGVKINVHNKIVNLKGEGSRLIGTSGLITNEYNTVVGRTGISGPANSFVFAVRCSDIEVNAKIINSGESGNIFRNCGNVKSDCIYENIAGTGTELSFPATDGSVSAMPIRENYEIKAKGKYINDLKLGAGNGILVSMAGSAVNEIFRNFKVDATGYRNSREIHQEFNSGSKAESFEFTVFSREALQGAVVTMGKNGKIKGFVLNPGSAGTGAVNTGYPELYGYRGSTNSDNIECNLQVISSFSDGFTLGTDGAITAGSAVFTSASASFPSDIVGKPVTIEGANPSGAPLEAYVVSRDSTTQLTLDLSAQVTVTGATYGYGTGCRTPLSFSGSGSVDFSGSIIKGGVFSGLASEPSARAVYFGAGSGISRIDDATILAPDLIGTATAPTGVEYSAGFSGKIVEEDNFISGFTNNYKGFSTNTSATLAPVGRKIVQDAFPSATAGVFGTDLTFTPRKQNFDFFFAMSVEFDGVSSETVTVEIEAYFVDGGSNKVTLVSSASTTVDLTTGQLATLHRDNQKITSLAFRVKSSKASSTAKGRLNYLSKE